MADENNDYSWDIETTERIGKILPNEFAKMGSVLRFIPYIGQALQILGAIDTGTTTYADINKGGQEQGMSEGEARRAAIMPTMQRSMAGYSGGTNPGIYGSQGNIDRNWADYVGMAGNLYGSAGGGSQGFTGKANYGGMMGNVGQIYGAASGQEDQEGIDFRNLNSGSQGGMAGMGGGGMGGLGMGNMGIGNMFGLGGSRGSTQQSNQDNFKNFYSWWRRWQEEQEEEKARNTLNNYLSLLVERQESPNLVSYYQEV